ncbi:hypothetical protein HYH02_011205 [Chlamydomonas schloesseri]|uniref:RBR-type E3 ubiquitin transferase n=1 Tax=Chlamydomonas schloesseri TaxID=2026947 RepID=A0A835W508_9CHLO|nr:hypothetical protein HYH02_011205 [Chlamydomonas schloesseri]|eukprot:KAG2437563.1 hypothetical protein HYH02_011205 [Chlamydomonas schloesseri]
MAAGRPLPPSPQVAPGRCRCRCLLHGWGSGGGGRQRRRPGAGHATAAATAVTAPAGCGWCPVWRSRRNGQQCVLAAAARSTTPDWLDKVHSCSGRRAASAGRPQGRPPTTQLPAAVLPHTEDVCRQLSRRGFWASLSVAGWLTVAAAGQAGILADMLKLAGVLFSDAVAAAEAGHLECLRVALHHVPRSDLKSVIMAALRSGHEHTAKWLVSHLLPPTPPPPGRHVALATRLLASAAESGSAALVRWLADDRELRCGLLSPEVLLAAVRSGCCELVAWLAAQGCSAARTRPAAAAAAGPYTQPPVPRSGGAADGGCGRELPRDVLLRGVAGRAEEQALAELEVLAAIPPSQRLYCPHPDCSALMERPDAGRPLLLVAGNERPETCLSCLRQFCAQCSIPGWHTGLTCAQYQALPPHQRLQASAEDAAILALVAACRWRRCPSCAHVVERSHGCNRMRCRCGARFCYACGTAFREGAVAACTCPYWGPAAAAAAAVAWPGAPGPQVAIAAAQPAVAARLDVAGAAAVRAAPAPAMARPAAATAAATAVPPVAAVRVAPAPAMARPAAATAAAAAVPPVAAVRAAPAPAMARPAAATAAATAVPPVAAVRAAPAPAMARPAAATVAAAAVPPVAAVRAAPAPAMARPAAATVAAAAVPPVDRQPPAARPRTAEGSPMMNFVGTAVTPTVMASAVTAALAIAPMASGGGQQPDPPLPLPPVPPLLSSLPAPLPADALPPLLDWVTSAGMRPVAVQSILGQHCSPEVRRVVAAAARLALAEREEAAAAASSHARWKKGTGSRAAVHDLGPPGLGSNASGHGSAGVRRRAGGAASLSRPATAALHAAAGGARRGGAALASAVVSGGPGNRLRQRYQPWQWRNARC